MGLDLLGGSGFSMPLGGSLYPPPPHHFHGARLAWAAYEVDAAAVAPFLPPGMRLDGEPPVCEFHVCDYPETSFGPYLEAYLFLRVTVGGRRYWYQPLIFTNREPALAAGREIWGYAKKLAVMEWREEGEQILFTIERPKGKRLATFTLTRDRLAGADSFEDLGILSLRYLPPSEAGRKPAAAELVEIRPAVAGIETPLLGPVLWAGRPSVAFDSESEVDPWYRFRPLRMLGGWYQRCNFSLPFGTVLKDYVAEGLFDKAG